MRSSAFYRNWRGYVGVKDVVGTLEVVIYSPVAKIIRPSYAGGR